ncbi:MAG: hypothetical protein JWM68_3397, partial [Verrucomicrobiales bacterium]|nr:hypothetical protein [Verrucomicrobiales bacterium]
ATGIKLADSTVAGDTMSAKADFVKAAVIAACSKRQHRTASIRTISLAPVRNADMPREMDSLCDSIGRLLERQLIQSPDITVLERERLEEINSERKLSTTTPSSDLLSALTLMELELGKSSIDSEIKATLFLSDGSGGAISKISLAGSQTNVPGLVDQLLNSVTKHLAVAPVERKLDREREASYFNREAQFLKTHNYLVRALAAAEAAYALEPEKELYQESLAACLFDVAMTLLQAAPVASADRDHPLPVPPELLRSIRLINRALSIHKMNIMGYLNPASRFEGGPDAETRELFETLQRQWRDELLSNSRITVVRDLNEFQQIVYWANLDVLPDLQYVSPTAHEWTTGSIEVISRWLEFSKTNLPFWDMQAGPPYHGGNGTTAPVNQLLGFPFLCTLVRDPYATSPLARWTLSADDYARWNELYESMQHHPLPVVQLYGKIGRLAVELRSTAVPTNEVIPRVESIVESAKQILKGLPPDSAKSQRILYYQAAIDAIEAAPVEYLDTQKRRALYDRLFTFMLSQRELTELVVARATQDFSGMYPVQPEQLVAGNNPGRAPTSHAAARLRNLEHVKALLDSADVRLLDSHREEFQEHLAKIRRTLAQPGSQVEQPKPWTEARLVFELRDGLERIDEAIVQDNVTYFVGLGRKEGRGFIQLVRLSISNGQIQMLGQAQHEWDEISNLGAVITGTCAQDGNIFVGTRRDGVFVFPANGGSPQHLTTTNGLPSNWVRSLACLENKLFLGLGEHEGFLVVYDLKEQHCNVIASSRRKEKRSPFDDTTPPFAVHSMRSDPLRQRIIALITAPTSPELAGLWQINPDSGELKQILKLAGEAWLLPNFVSPIRNNRLLLHDWGSRCIIDFDLRNDQAKLLYAGSPYGSFHSLQPAKETARVWINRSGPFLVVDGSVWTGEDFGRFSRDLPKGESFPALPGEKLPRLAGCMSGLEMVGNGRQVLVVQKTKVWLLTLPKESARNSTP